MSFFSRRVKRSNWVDTSAELGRSVNWFKGKTVLAIAHRLSTIENADKVVVLEKGEITEQGTFKQLLKNKGKFYYYWKLQMDLS